MNKKIKFSEEWDKIRKENRVVGKEFTTARGYEPRKHAYYSDSIGSVFDILLKGEKIGEGKLHRNEFGWAISKPLSFWKKDTYKHYTWKDIAEIMKQFYHLANPFMIYLYLEWTKVEEEE